MSDTFDMGSEVLLIVADNSICMQRYFSVVDSHL